MEKGKLRLDAWVGGAALAPVEPVTAVDSSTALVGNARGKALGDDERAIDNYLSSDHPQRDPAFVRAFLRAPATGCTTLVDMARITSGWDPLAPEDPVNVARYYNYIRAIDANPMFDLFHADEVAYTRTSEDWPAAVHAIADLFEGVGSEDKELIEQSLVQMAAAAASRERKKPSKNIFAQNTLLVDDDRIEYSVYSGLVELAPEKSKSRVTTTTFRILRARFEFHKVAWNEITATAVAECHFRSLTHWLHGFRTRDLEPCQRVACVESARHLGTCERDARGVRVPAHEILQA